MPYAPVRKFYRSLRFKLTLWNTLTVLCTCLFALGMVREGLRWSLLQEVDQYLQEDLLELTLTAQALNPQLDEIHAEMNRKAEGHAKHGFFVQIFDARGQLLWSSVNTPPYPKFHEPLLSHPPREWKNFRLAERPLQLPGMPLQTLRVGSTLEHIENDVMRLSQVLALVGVMLLIAAPLGGYLLAGRAIAPLANIIQTAARLRPRNLSERLKIRGTNDELDQLSRTINHLLDRIGEYLNHHRDFLANAAHELRSPLAAIRNSAEVALNSDRTAAEYQELLEQIVEECGGLGSLVNQLLVLAENEVRGQNTVFVPVRLDRVIGKAVEMFRGVAEEKGIALETGSLATVEVLGDAGRIRQVLNNLLDNSLKFTPAEGKVLVTLEELPASGQVQLCVADNGQGISKDDLPRVCERFYRADKARQSRGTGLGLSICEAIVYNLGGDLVVSSELGVGTKITVRLPILTPQPTVPVASLPDGVSA